MPGKSSRVTLKFNDYDFRHKKALQILKSRPRHMTELIVDAILHYIVCPDAGRDMSREWIRSVLKEELAAMLPDIGRRVAPAAETTDKTAIRDEDMADLGDVMDMFRRSDQS